MHDNEADKTIIRRVTGGQSDAYAIIVRRYQLYVFTLVLRYVPQREQAEELAQDVFVKAYNFLRDYREESKFSTWLYSIVYTTAMTFLRKRKLDTSSIDDENNHLQLENQSGGFKNDMAENKSRSYYVNQAIEQLLPDDALIN